MWATPTRAWERFDEALAFLQRAAHLAPDNAYAHSNLSIVYLHLGRYGDVITACQRQIAIEDDSSARRMLGYVYGRLGHYRDAIAQLERSVALDPGDYEARGALARAYRIVGRCEEADHEYALAAELAQQDGYYGRACLAAVSGDVDTALALLQMALVRDKVQRGWVRIDPEFAAISDARFAGASRFGVTDSSVTVTDKSVTRNRSNT